MTEEVRLSICMPTYNFGAFIAETLDSIVPQLAPGVEVLILDGGSTDDTTEVVRGYLDRGLPIRYVRQDTRGGIDRDMARTVELAQGEYCWLFSSDDIMVPGAIAYVLNEIKSDLDLYLCGMVLCDRDMKVIAKHPISGARQGQVFQLDVDVDRHHYFELAETTTALFSFMGSLIFKRARWMQQVLDENYIGSLWAHVVRFMRMIPDGLALKYIEIPLLHKRSGNDSFMEKGLVNRYAMAIDGYQRIASDLFGDNSFEARHVRRTLVNEFPPRIFSTLKTTSIVENRHMEVPEIERLVRKTYCDPTMRNWAYRFVYKFSIIPLYDMVKMFGKGIIRKVLRKSESA